MIGDVLRFAAVVSAALTAGGLTVVAAAIVPSYRQVAGSGWVGVHQRLDPVLHRYMLRPGIATIALAVQVAIVSPGSGHLYGALGAAAAGVVGVVSEAGNAPINRTVRQWDAAVPPADAPDKLAKWARFNWIRTVAAFVALVSLLLAAVTG